MDLVYPLSGFVVGTIVGLTGVGGGSLMTPLLILLFGFAPATAVGTDLLYAGVSKSAATLVHLRRGNVDWRMVGLMSAGSVPAAGVTVLALRALLPDTRAMSAVLSVALGIALVATAVALLLRDRLASWRAGHATATTHVSSWRPVALGVALGILVTLSSVGAGALGTVALVVLLPRAPTVRIVGTDIAHAVPLTLIAGLGHAALGHVNWPLLASLLAGSIPGIWLGSRAAARIPERWLRGTLAAVLVVVAVRLLA
jgi:hypothetical protein